MHDTASYDPFPKEYELSECACARMKCSCINMHLVTTHKKNTSIDARTDARIILHATNMYVATTLKKIRGAYATALHLVFFIHTTLPSPQKNTVVKK